MLSCITLRAHTLQPRISGCKFIGLFTDARVRNKNTGLNLYYFYSLYCILFYLARK